jgi:hypothetical protein
MEENPSVRLAPIIVRLFELAGDTRLPEKTRNSAFFFASKLRGAMVNLISKRFEKATAEYVGAMDELKRVNADLQKAKDDIEKLVETIKGLAALATALDKALKTVAVV